MSPSSAMMSAKAEEIGRVLSEPMVDLWKLRELALTEGGLVNGKILVQSIVALSLLLRV
jgi:hypothetical protein